MTKNCWNDNGYHSQRGWGELHSIDYMVRISPPVVPHPVAFYETCESAGQVIDVGDVVWPWPLPYPNSYISALNTAVSTDSWNGQFSVNANTQAFSLYAVAQIHAAGSTAGVYAGFEVIWGCRRNQCGPDDGCGNLSPTAGCSTGYTCNGSGCVCNAPGYGWCTPTNDCRLTSQCCIPNCSTSCGGTPNGCGGTCPNPCNVGETCSGGVCSCTPQCGNANCGMPDGCGGVCPDCCPGCSTP